MEEGEGDARQGLRILVIRSALPSIGPSNTFDSDLDHAADVLRRSVQQLKLYRMQKEGGGGSGSRSVGNAAGLNEKDTLKAMLTLHTMNSLENALREKK